VLAASRDPRLLRARSARPDEPTWRTRGRCRTVDPETFFPLPTEPTEPALSFCHGCEVQAECLAAALNAGDCEGVWGATTPRERRAMLVAWRNRTGMAGAPTSFQTAARAAAAQRERRSDGSRPADASR